MKANVKLLKKESVAKDTMAFHLSKPEDFEFRAGQFANFTLIDPEETDGEGNSREFSLVKPPYEPELMIATRLRDSAFKRVLQDLPVDSEIKMDGPIGGFTLHKTETTPAVFIIGGIGVTPIYSMIAQAIHEQTDHQMTLLHASPTPDDLPLQDGFERLAKDSSAFKYVQVATDSAPDDWQGERGRINAEIVQKHVPDLDQPIYYLSGPGGMVEAMRQLLVDLEVNEDKIRTEEFAGY
jgi:ferredoxin-NADP reductase